MANLGLPTLKAKRRTANRSKKRARRQCFLRNSVPVNMDAHPPSSPLRPSNVDALGLVSSTARPPPLVRSPRLACLSDSCLNFAIHIRENPQSENSVAPIGEQRRDVVGARKSSSYASGDDHSTLRLFRHMQGSQFYGE